MSVVHLVCTRCGTGRSVDPATMVVALPEPDVLAVDDAHPAELLHPCGACGTTVLRRLPRALGVAMIVLGASPLAPFDLPGCACSPAPSPHGAPRAEADEGGRPQRP